MLQRGNTEFSETTKIWSFQYRNLGFGANFKNPRLDPIGICGLLSFFEPTHCQDHCESQQAVCFANASPQSRSRSTKTDRPWTSIWVGHTKISSASLFRIPPTPWPKHLTMAGRRRRWIQPHLGRLGKCTDHEEPPINPLVNPRDITIFNSDVKLPEGIPFI